MLPLPPVISFTLGAIGAAALAKVLVKEWLRVNAVLDAQAAEAAGHEDLPTLRRDPHTGIYRPE
jgi:hypothetical protein